MYSETHYENPGHVRVGVASGLTDGNGAVVECVSGDYVQFDAEL